MYNGEPLFVLRHRQSGRFKTHSGAHTTPGLYRLSDARRIVRRENRWRQRQATYGTPREIDLNDVYEIVPIDLILRPERGITTE